MGPGIREAGLSVARKNGKSGLISAVLLAYLLGPLNSPRWRGIVVSLTGNLAAELRDAIEVTAAVSGLEGLKIKRHPPPGSIDGRDGAVLSILASDRATGHAVGADLAIIDEAGLLGENRRELWNAVLSSTSGRDGRLICISIQGDGPMFSELQQRKDDPAVVFHLYAADDDAALDDEAQWHKANPGLRAGIKSLSYMRDLSRKSISSPADAPAFRAYDLNLPQSPSVETVCSVEDWRACECDPDDLPPRQGPCVVGVDLGGSSSLTALAAFWPHTGRLEVRAAVGDNPPLLERSRADGMGGLYVDMERRGELRTYPGRVTPVASFLTDCADLLAGCDVVVAGADRYRRAEGEDAMGRPGFAGRWSGVGRGVVSGRWFARRSGISASRSFGKLKIEESLLMRSAIMESRVRRDSSGNPALDKRRDHGRIDALSATVIAAGLGELVANRPRSRGRVVVVNPGMRWWTRYEQESPWQGPG